MHLASQLRLNHCAKGSRLSVQCRQGGGSGDSRLIIPGQSPTPPPRPGGRIVIPGQSGSGAPSGGRSLAGGLSSLDSDVPAAARNSFRPPPGFMDASNPSKGEDEVGMSTEAMLNRLQAQAGKWYQLAKLLPALQRAGIDATTIQDITGMERRLQNLWTSALQVYESVKRSGVLTPEQMAVFDYEADALYELRYLSGTQRTPAAQYLADHMLTPSEAQILARAIKEYERRDGSQEGFTDSPADCLAFKYYRDSLECGGTNKKQDTENCIKKGLSIAGITTAAKEKLMSQLEEGAVAAEEEPLNARLTMLRLTKDEVGYRPIVLLGDMGSVSADHIKEGPKVCTESATFSAFTIPENASNKQWVCLPNWSVLLRAGRPVAIMIKNCMDVPAVRSALGYKHDEDVKHVAGPGLVVVDAEPESLEVIETEYYMAESGGGGAAQLVSGAAFAPGMRPVAKVLFVCRQPARDATGIETSELLSI